MKLYLTDTQVPEMSQLQLRQRRAVRRGGYQMFCAEQPSRDRIVRFVNMLAVVMGGAFGWAVHQIGGTWFSAYSVAVATAGLIELVFQSALTERLRPYFQRYLSEHKDEIAQIG